MNKKFWLVIGTLILVAIITFALYSYHVLNIPIPGGAPRQLFKVKEIYPTKPGGREWFIDMNNPSSDGIFDPGSPTSKQSDESWRINGNVRPDSKSEDQIRMTVGTPKGGEKWKNVEIEKR